MDLPMTPETWKRLLRRSATDAGTALFGPLLGPGAGDGCFVIGRIAQSLDGFIATSRGESYWISGPDDIAHTHRLRALCDAVVVGAGTVHADDPQLTTRLVEGPSPVRVVIDPARRLAPDRRVFQGDPPTLILCAPEALRLPDLTSADRPDVAEVVAVPCGPDGMAPAAIIQALAARGLRRIFIEGGGVTVTRFLTAGWLDRLHVTVAPVLIGSGIPAFPLPPAPALAEARRFDWTVHRVGRDVLLDIALERRTLPP
jgi:diaminohydroxyphosphoribosylaminopyrimidine deaminase / 5-amino-6-(5-phosphoribosylamino)uracil reductase